MQVFHRLKSLLLILAFVFSVGMTASFVPSFLIKPVFAEEDVAEEDDGWGYEPRFDPLPLPPLDAPKRNKPSGPLDGKALICTYSVQDSFYVLSPAYFLFLKGGVQLIEELPKRKFNLIEGSVELYDSSIHLYINQGSRWDGDRILNRRSMQMVHRDKASQRKVTGQCEMADPDAIMEIFGKRYFKKF